MLNRKIRAMLIAFGMTVCTVANAEIYSATAAFFGFENGLSYGYELDAKTQKAARQDALDRCNRKIKKGPGTCKIKQEFAGPGCIALAVRGDGGEYALAKSKTNSGEAQSKALNACNEKSIKHDCRIVVSDCTTNIADSGKKDDSGLAGWRMLMAMTATTHKAAMTWRGWKMHTATTMGRVKRCKNGRKVLTDSKRRFIPIY